MKKYILLTLFITISSYAEIQSIFIEGVKLDESQKGFNVVCYKSIDPWIIMSKTFVADDLVDFLKGCKPPIWITFKDDKVATILCDGKRMKGENLKDSEKEKILKFRKYLEDNE